MEYFDCNEKLPDPYVTVIAEDSSGCPAFAYINCDGGWVLAIFCDCCCQWPHGEVLKWTKYIDSEGDEINQKEINSF